MKVYVLTLVNLSTIDTDINGEYNNKVFTDYETAKKELQEWKDGEYKILTEEDGQDVTISETEEGDFVYMTWHDGEEGEMIDIRELEVN